VVGACTQQPRPAAGRDVPAHGSKLITARIDIPPPPAPQESPFFTVKLGIKVLPCVVMFKNGVSVDRVVGFEQLGGKDDFPTVVRGRGWLGGARGGGGGVGGGSRNPGRPPRRPCRRQAWWGHKLARPNANPHLTAYAAAPAGV
jgi:hypothetical protein